MAEPFIGEIKICSFSYAPRGWAQCNGQILPISQNQALFSLLGTVFGGNGQTTFGLPNLQGQVPIHVGPQHVLGQKAGEPTHTLTPNEMPTHLHQLQGTSTAGTVAIPAGNLLGVTASNSPEYHAADAQVGALADGSLAPSGGGQAHPNMQPYLPLNLCIALQGIYPSRD